MLKIRMNPNPKGSSDFQQFAPFRVGVNKLLKIEIMGFLSDTTCVIMLHFDSTR